MSARLAILLLALFFTMPTLSAQTTVPARGPDLSEMREQERTTAAQLREVDQQLDRLSQQQSVASATTTPAESSDARQRRAAALKDMKTRHQARLDELSRDLRERVVRLSIDGAGVPGQFSAKELELKRLIEMQFDLSRNAADARAALDAAMAKVSNGEDLPAVREQIERDPNVQAMRKMLAELENPARLLPPHQPGAKPPAPQQMQTELQRKLDDAIAEVRARATASLLEALRRQKDVIESQQKNIAEKVDSTKADLGDLTNAMQKYLAAKDEEQALRQSVRRLDEQLEALELSAKSGEDAAQAKRRAEEQLQAQSAQLNNLKTKYQFRLDELRRQIRQVETDQAAGMFAGVVDVYLSADEVSGGKPSLSGVTFVGTTELAGRQFVRLKNDTRTWSIDPARIVAVCSSGAATKSKAEPG